MSMHKLPGLADLELVREACQMLTGHYQRWLREKRQAGIDVNAVDEQMIGHNFYKGILYHIVDERISHMDILASDRIEARREMIAVAMATFSAVLNQGTHEGDRGLS
jgi:hypothetical protein